MTAAVGWWMGGPAKYAFGGAGGILVVVGVYHYLKARRRG
jgi:hypothetical protein